MSIRKYTNADGGTTLNSLINNTTTSVVVASAAGFPATTPFTAVLDPGTSSAEVVLVTAVAGTTLTVTRGYDNTTAQSHASGASIKSCVASIDFTEANSHVNASSGVHGATGSVVGTSDAQTLTNKTLTSPTINGTVAGTAGYSGASFAATGALSGASVTVTGAVQGASVTATGASGMSSANGPVRAKTLAGGTTGAEFTADATGAIAGASLAVSGAVTAGGAVTATGDVTGAHVAGIFRPKVYADQAAAGTGTVGDVVRLSAPTGTNIKPGLFVWNTSIGAWVPLRATSRARLRRAVGVNVGSGAFSLIGPDTSDFLVGGSMTANGFQVVYPGFYLVSTAISCAASGGRVQAACGLNSTMIGDSQGVILDTASGVTAVSTPYLVSCAANDTINLYAFQDSGAIHSVTGVLSVQQYDYPGE